MVAIGAVFTLTRSSEAFNITRPAASTVAGVLWDQLGAPATFAAGACFSLTALVLLWLWRSAASRKVS